MSKEVRSNPEPRHHFRLWDLVRLLPVIALPFLAACTKPELPSQILAVTYDPEGPYQRRALVLFEDNPVGEVHTEPQILLDGLEANFPGIIALSPDGNTVLTVIWDEHDWDIFSLNVVDNVLTNLTNDEEDNFEPVWSPDGKKIAYETSNPNILGVDIYIMDSNGQSVRKITDGKRVYVDPVWSPDGSKIALRSYEKGHGSDFNFSLEILDVESGQIESLGEIDGLQEYAWSPDGKKIVYNGLDQSDYYSDLFVVDLETQKTNNITPLPNHQWGIDWSNDGRQIVFDSDHQDGTPDICLVHPDGTDLHCLTENIYDLLSPQFSSDSRYIYFTSDLGQTNNHNALFRISVEGGIPENVSFTLPVPHTEVYTFKLGRQHSEPSMISPFTNMVK